MDIAIINLMRELLKKLSFSEKEADVYLAAFKLGSGPVSSLAKQAKVKRPTAYVILEKLNKMGLVILEKRGNKQIFVAQNPQKLLEVIGERKKKLQEKEERLKKTLPQFKAMTKKESYIPSIRYYEGKESVWNVIEDQIATTAETWAIVPGKIYDVLGTARMMKDIIKRRRQIGKKIYLITDHHGEMVKLWKLEETSVREFRFVPEKIELNTTVYIYADKIALAFWEEPLKGLIIENKELFQVMKFMFNSLWKELEGENLPE